MRITQIDILKFGAVENFALEAAPITVICGNNESGKTTILDAMLEALFSISTRTDAAQFEGTNRYEPGGAFEGNMHLERNGKPIRFPSPDGVTLDSMAGFPPIYIKNLLVVRESDLQFHDKYETWWSGIKDHLSGFKGGLGAVVNAVLQEAGLTRDGDWINEKGRRIKDEVGHLRETEQRLKSLREDAEEMAKLRSRLRHLSLRREVAAKELDLLKRAKHKEQLETASMLRLKMQEERERAIELAKYDESSHSKWRHLEADIEAIQEGMRGLDRQKDTTIARIKETEEEASRHEEDSRVWARKQVEVLPSVQTGLQEIKTMYERERRLLSHQNFLFGGTTILAALGVSFLSFALFSGRPEYLLPAITSFGGSAICAGLWLLRRSLSRKLALSKTKLLEGFHNLGEEAASIDDVQSWVLTARSSPQQAHAAAETLRREAQKDQNDLQHLDSTIDERKKLLRELQAELDSLKNESGCQTIEEFEARMQERTHVGDGISSLADKVNILLKCEEDEWDEKLDELESYRDIETIWDEEAQIRLEEELPGLAHEEEVLRGRVVAIEKKLIELGCNSPEDAWQIEKDVMRRLLAYERDRRATDVALDILSELLQHQDSIINTVLESGGHSATHYFKQVTGGRYNSVFWRDDASPAGATGLYAQTPDGKTFNIESLSTGTQAQLQFSLRVSLLAHLFGGEPLFLLLDDPFLTSDRSRIKELMQTLVDFCDEGWQIIYFTIDEEVPLILEELCSEKPGKVVVEHLAQLET